MNMLAGIANSIGARATHAACFGVALVLGACSDGVDRDLVRVAEEREAIEILDMLRDPLRSANLVAEKQAVKDGQKTVWQIKVLNCTQADLDQAIRELVRSNLPRTRYPGFDEMFSGGKLIPSETEDRARYVNAREGELQNALLAIPGVISAGVNLALPREVRGAEPKSLVPASASVVLKFRDVSFAQPFISEKPIVAPAADAEKAPFVPQGSKDFVRQMVASGVEGLEPERVTVLVTVEGKQGILGSDDVPALAAPEVASNSLLDQPAWAGVRKKLEAEFKDKPGDALTRLDTAPSAAGGDVSSKSIWMYQLGLIGLGLAAILALVSLLKTRSALRKALRR
jgi:type III secretory pathway lipoprotein EscJ